MGMFDALRDRIQKGEELYIYGAQHHAHCMCIALKLLLPHIRIPHFIVADRTGNPPNLEGIPVKELRECAEHKKDILILVACSEKYYGEIETALLAAGFTNIINGTFGGEFDHEVRELYFNTVKGEHGFTMLKEVQMPEACLKEDRETAEEKDRNERKTVSVYMAKSVADRPLQSAGEIPPYMHTVQAGAALTEEKIAEHRDDLGINISCKNRNYCECTVTHYVWQHAKEDYVGLCHYRRRFPWDDTDMEKIEAGLVDVILPNPVITVKGGYGIHHKPYVGDWEYNTMLRVLQDEYPEYYQTALEVMEGDLFYPCNMVLAKREIFGAYAAWLFDVLFKVEAVCGNENERTDRYLGYLAEHLTTFYFVHNRNSLRIAHSRMEILK